MPPPLTSGRHSESVKLAGDGGNGRVPFGPDVVQDWRQACREGVGFGLRPATDTPEQKWVLPGP